MKIEEIILDARECGASDIHLDANKQPIYRINGHLAPSERLFNAKDIEGAILESLSTEKQLDITNGLDVDFAIQTSDKNRQRVNVFHEQGNLCATIRLLNSEIPTMEQLGLPSVLYDLAKNQRGIILVTGPTGSGKSTTLACMIDYINKTRAEHILTAEDPIEYVYTPSKSVIHQREVGTDVQSFAAALRSALREDPDVILVGEMRDFETISAAVTAAETGHLVLSTLHTTGVAQTVDRIIDACPAGAQNQIRSQLSTIIKGIITQSLIPTADGKSRVAATEVLIGTDAILNLIRENKTHQIASTLQSGLSSGMHTLNSDLFRLWSDNKITKDDAFRYSNDKADLKQFIPN